MTPPASARLLVLFAPEAPRAVVYRRGPTKATQMWLWETDRDRFTPGQWIEGKVNGASLSPDGRYVVSEVMRGDQHTVLSRPPYFSALAITVASLCVTSFGFGSDGSLIGSPAEFRAPKAQCPFRFGVRSGDRVQNYVLQSDDPDPVRGLDPRGREVILQEGRIGVVQKGATRWLIDLNPFTPENVPPSNWALRW